MTSIESQPLATPAYCHRRRELIAAGAGVLTAMALGLPLSGCAQNEQLGRSQLILVSDAELEQMSNQAEQDIRRRTGVLRDPARQRFPSARRCRTSTRLPHGRDATPRRSGPPA